MSNAIAQKGNTQMAALSALKKGISKTRQALPSSSTQPILRMQKDGVWVYGAENIEVEEGSIWAFNVMSVQHGFTCWTNYPDKGPDKRKNEFKGEAYASLFSDALDPYKLPKHEDAFGTPCEWKPASTVELVCTNGEDAGEQVIYKPSSVGGGNFMDAILAAIDKQIDTGSDEIIPLIELDDDHYDNKNYGKTYVPKFKIKGWRAADDATPIDTSEAMEAEEVEEVEVDEAPVEDEVETPKAKTRTRAKAEDKPKSEDKPKTEGRTRRRRRAS